MIGEAKVLAKRENCPGRSKRYRETMGNQTTAERQYRPRKSGFSGERGFNVLYGKLFNRMGDAGGRTKGTAREDRSIGGAFNKEKNVLQAKRHKTK